MLAGIGSDAGERRTGGTELEEDRVGVTGRQDTEGTLGAWVIRAWQLDTDDGETSTGMTGK